MLSGVGDFTGNAEPIGAHQGQVFAVGFKLEAGVQLAARGCPVLARGKDNKVAACRDFNRWELPAVEVFRGVSKEPSARGGGVNPRVLNFNPV